MKIMKKHVLVPAIALVFLMSSCPMYGQVGCEDSPENPTAILALVGIAGVCVAQMRSRLKARKSPKQSASCPSNEVTENS